jgi:hypothetical protein
MGFTGRLRILFNAPANGFILGCQKIEFLDLAENAFHHSFNSSKGTQGMETAQGSFSMPQSD